VHLGAALIAVGALAVAAQPAAAKQKPITGSVTKGYTVIALADDGRVATAVAKPAFRLTPPAKRVTLHLRNRNGSYAGPVVAGVKKPKAVLGVKAGAALGKLSVKRGYAKPRRRVAARMLDAKRLARAKQGVPVGAARLGLISGSATAPAGAGRDADADGIPGAFDVDDDGDMVLDNVDRSPAASAAVAVPADAMPFWVINAGLEVSYIADDKGITQGAAGYALNQNAAGPFAGDANFEKLRDLIMVDRGELFFRIDSADPSELDCGGLSYCRLGGTGYFHNRMQPFPAAFDPDHDGFGSMSPAGAFAEGQNGLGTMQAFSPNDVFGLAPLAGAAAIGSGDTFIQRFQSDVNRTLSINTVFGTLPALQGWSDGSTSHVVGYPVPRGGLGSESTPFEVEKSASGDYVLTLTVWRPQRRPIPGSAEPAGWLDMGGLTYKVVGKTVEQNRRLWNCPADAYSASGGPAPGNGGVIDSAPIQPANPSNTLTFAVNLSACMRASGLGDWKPGDVPSDLFVTALSATGDAAEGVGFAFKPKTGGASADQFTGTWRFPSGSPESTVTYTITANGTAETSHFGIIAYAPRAITGGSTPAGWTCQLGSAGPNPMWECTGGTIRPGAPVTGSVTLSQSGENNMSLDMLICDAANQCKGFGMTQRQ
jgi:hypothetical protein